MRSRDNNSSWHTCAEDEDRKVADGRKTGETNEGKEGPAATEGAPREEEGPGGSYMCLNYFVVYLVDFGS
jgi:hypothetical protein